MTDAARTTGPVEFRTYDELSGKPVSATISADALALALKHVLGIAARSPHWTPGMRDGARGTVDYLVSHFSLAGDV